MTYVVENTIFSHLTTSKTHTHTQPQQTNGFWDNPNARVGNLKEPFLKSTLKSLATAKLW